MHFIYRREEMDKVQAQSGQPEAEVARPLWQNALYFASMIGILVFANWGRPAAQEGLWHAIFSAKWQVTSLFGIALGVMLVRWFSVAWWKVVLAGLPVVVLALLLPQWPVVAFVAGVIGTFGADQHRVRRDG
jgi:uncharacterized protein